MDAPTPNTERPAADPAERTTRGLLAGLLLAASLPTALWALTEPAAAALLLAAAAGLAFRYS